ncbi:putative ribonuclease H-like domain-containing protein [Tanacetum coccineum]
MSKKQDCTAMVAVEVEYVALSASCAQVERGIIELYFVRTEYQLADLLTKVLSQDRFDYLVRRLDHNLWDVIVNRDLEEEPAPTGETSAPPAPKTAKQLAARRNQERVKSILLLAIPDEYLLKFHNVADAKSLWEAIKSRFGGNVESKKMQKNVLKHQFENFSTASNESLDKAYDRFQKLISQLEVHGAPISKEDINQKFLRSLPSSWNQISLIMRNKPDIDEIDIDDLYNNLRVYEDELKRSSGSNSASQNLAFLSSENTSSTNEVSTASGDFRVSTAGGINQVPSTPCAHDIDGDDLEELDLRWQVAMLTVRVKKKGHFARECRSGRNQGRRSYGDNGRSNAPTNESSSQALVAQDGLGGYDWSNDFEVEPVNYALMVISSSSSSSSSDSEKVVKDRDELKDKIAKWEESSKNLDEILNSQMSARDKTGLDEYAIRNKIIESQTTKLNTKTSETAGQTNDENIKKPKSASESVVSNPKIDRDRVIIEDWNSDDEEEVNEVQTVRLETQTVKTRDDKSGQNSQKQGIRVLTRTGSTARPVCTARPSVSTARPVCTARPSVSTARPSVSTARPVCTARPSVSTARPVCTARPSVSTARPVYATRPIYPRMDNVRPRGSCSPIKRSYYTKPAFRPKDLKQDVKTFGVQNMTTAGTRAVVNTGKGKLDTDLKKSRWVWRPKGNYLDHVSKDSGSFMLKKGNPEILLQDHAVVDSGCSSHMTGNKAYLSDYEDFNGGFVAFGSDPKGGKITGKGKIKTANLDFDDVYFVDELKFNLFSVSQMCDKKNSVLFTESECLILSPSFKLLDESQVVLRAPRKDDVYSLDLKNIVPSGGITCLYANATADESKLWHRRLGHVNFKNINKLVKGHLVRGLPSKVFVNDHTCVSCKKGKQHQASCKAKLERIIRKPLELLHMDLFGTVFVDSINKKREFSVARTPQQNGVAERKNKTLIEAARTMVLVTKPQNKTPYELLIDKDIQDSEDVIDKEGQHQMPEDEQVLHDVLEKMKAAQATSTNILSTDRPSVRTDRPFVSTDRSNTPYVSAVSTHIGANAGESSFVYLGGKIPIDASTLPNADISIDLNMPDLEDASDTLPNDGIFNGAYDDDEDMGAVADFNNMDNTIVVSPIPTLRIHKDHPKGQILRDPTSAVQTRGKIQKASSAQQALVEAMQEELLQFKLQKVWVLVDLPYGKKVIGTKWVFIGMATGWVRGGF